MKKRIFKTQDEFLKALDGKIYSIGNSKNEVLICDLLEEDFIKFLNEGKIIDLTTNKNVPTTQNMVSDYFISARKYVTEVYDSKVVIVIG